jgi:diguanylate cyclase (GGDEF)-like protein/PAS domain S-box-containing protein
VDRFVDHRFLQEWGRAGHGFAGADPLSAGIDMPHSADFEEISPCIMRWVADRHGRLIGWWSVSGPSRRPAIDPVGLGWRALFDAAGRRALISASGERHPSPVMVTLSLEPGRPRWCRVEMRRHALPGGDWRYYGIVVDAQPYQDLLSAAVAESRDHYRWSVALSPQVPWTAGPDGAIEEVGPRFAEMTGISKEEALGQGWATVLHPDDVARVLAIWDRHLVNGDPVDIDYRVRLRSGRYRWMRACAAARRGADGRIIRWYGSLEDVHERHLAEHNLAQSEERFRLAIQSAGLGIWDFDSRTGQRSWSPELRAMLGVSPDVTPTAELALSLVHPDDRPRLQDKLGAVAAGVLPSHFEDMLRIYRATDGALRWIKSTGWTTRCDTDRSVRIIITFLDVTEQQDSERRIRWAATHDAMTRLPNRSSWQQTLDDMAEAALRSGDNFALLLMDIDDLKRTNDSLGHDAGDALLCAFAERLQAVAPPDAVIGRLGGDEFGLLSGMLSDATRAEAWGNALIETLRRPHMHEGRSLDCGVSIGAALFGSDAGSEGDELFKAADLALYASKAAGRGRLTLFHSSLRAEAQQRSSMIRMARQIIADDLIVPYYQPKVDLRTRMVTGYEALLRWCHPRLGVQLPGSIAAAFDHGEIAVGLTQTMLDKLLHDIVRWLDAGLDPGSVAFNASAADFTHAGFADSVLERLRRADIPTRHLELEVTETVFLGRGADQVATALRCFAKEGVRVALDDFGTGYASLSHLKHYPVDVLKIDRSFVSNMDNDAGDAAIVDAIVKLGDSFGMEVVAEGVETELQAQLLLAHGCPIGQGFHLGRPQPFDVVTARMR